MFSLSIPLTFLPLPPFCQLHCPAALKRVEIGVSAVTEYGGQKQDRRKAKHVAATVAGFITLIDTLSLTVKDVSELFPLVKNLMDSINSVDDLPAEFEAKEKIRHWLVKLSALSASDTLTAEDTQQMLMDTEVAHTAFTRALEE